LAKCSAAQNFDKALDGLQTVLDIAGFIPGIGNAMDAINLGISIFRGNVLDSEFSAIAIIPGLGSAISTPLKTIFNAVGNSSSITKAVNTLGTLFGGTSKILSKLSGISSGIRKLANKIPSAIASLKNDYAAKSLISKKILMCSGYNLMQL
jgi:hypothetical protein